MLINKDNKELYRHVYCSYLRSLSLMTDVHIGGAYDESWSLNEFNLLDSCYLSCDYPSYWVRSMYREVGSPDDKMRSPDIVNEFVMMCVGHKINPKKFLKFPRLCVLYSWKILKDRFKLAEDSISVDGLASYFYSKYVMRGILPPAMHNCLVLRSFERRDYHVARYLRDFSGFSHLLYKRK